MVKIEGKSVFGGIAIGPVEILKNKDNQVLRRHVEDTKKKSAAMKLREMRRKTASESL